MVKDVRNAFDEYDLNKVVHYLSSFVSDDLSNWYIRRNRNRFWGSTLDNSKKSVYITTYEVLTGLSKLIAPIVPFTSEELYRNLTNDESVHLTDYPVCDESLINDSLEEKMDLVRTLISTGRYVREENKIKVRQPLSEVLIDGKNEEVLGDLTTLIMEELNVKKVTFAKDLNTYMNFTIKPNFKEVGKVFGKNMGEFQKLLLDLSSEEIDKLQKGENISMTVAGEVYEVTPNMVDIRYNAKEGFNVGMENGSFIILNTQITKELKDEGHAREFVSKVQQLRKDNGFDIADRITTTFNADSEMKDAILSMKEYVQNETLSTEIIYDENITKDTKLNDLEVGIKLEKNN